LCGLVRLVHNEQLSQQVYNMRSCPRSAPLSLQPAASHRTGKHKFSVHYHAIGKWMAGYACLVDGVEGKFQSIFSLSLKRHYG
jgi:hypothetical protein